jgi:hypothetical protein
MERFSRSSEDPDPLYCSFCVSIHTHRPQCVKIVCVGHKGELFSSAHNGLGPLGLCSRCCCRVQDLLLPWEGCESDSDAKKWEPVILPRDPDEPELPPYGAYGMCFLCLATSSDEGIPQPEYHRMTFLQAYEHATAKLGFFEGAYQVALEAGLKVTRPVSGTIVTMVCYSTPPFQCGPRFCCRERQLWIANSPFRLAGSSLRDSKRERQSELS